MPTSPPPFVAGQLWMYRTRAGEDRSRVRVLLVESRPSLGEVVHVRVEGLQMRNPSARKGFSKVIGHMPFAADALRACFFELVGEQPVPDGWQDGYAQWKEAFDAGNAGVFTITVAEAVDCAEQGLAGLT